MPLGNQLHTARPQTSSQMTTKLLTSRYMTTELRQNAHHFFRLDHKLQAARPPSRYGATLRPLGYHLPANLPPTSRRWKQMRLAANFPQIGDKLHTINSKLYGRNSARVPC